MVSLITKNWRIDSIETILFDKDGTFIDLHFFWGKMTELRCEEIIKRFKLDDNCLSQLCLYLGYDTNTKKMLSDGITALYSRSKIIEIFAKNLQELGVQASEKELTDIFDNVSEEFYKNLIDYTKPIKDAITFIKTAHSLGIKLGIVTSDSVKSTELTLKAFDWESLFNVYFGRESSSETKESGALTKLALDALGANPQTTIMIGDAPMDYISAKNAGIDKTILVASGQIESPNLKKISPFVVESLNEITIQ